MRKLRKLIALVLAMVSIASLAITVSAAKNVSSEAGEFGVLTGSLAKKLEGDGDNGILAYCELRFFTSVTQIPGGSARLYATVSYSNNATGAYLGNAEAIGYQPGSTTLAACVSVADIPNLWGENAITLGVFGAHEARYTNSYAVYTSTNYNIDRDHSIS